MQNFVKRKNITAFILAGGLSSRMGTNKALLKIGEKTLIQALIEILDPFFFEVVISSNEPALFSFTNKKIIKDLISHRGPLGGIHSALHSTKTKMNFFISCDLPFINKDIIDYMCEYKSENNIILPRADGRIQQLCGIYSKNILNEVEKLLIESGQNNSKLKGSIYELIDMIPTEIIDVDRLDFYFPNIFLNINTPEDYERAKNHFQK